MQKEKKARPPPPQAPTTPNCSFLCLSAPLPHRVNLRRVEREKRTVIQFRIHKSVVFSFTFPQDPSSIFIHRNQCFRTSFGNQQEEKMKENLIRTLLIWFLLSLISPFKAFYNCNLIAPMTYGEYFNYYFRFFTPNRHLKFSN